MSISAGSSAVYYRCQTNRTKGNATCANRVSVREDIARLKILGAIQEHMNGPEGAAQLRERLQIDLRDYRERIEAEITTRRLRIDGVKNKLKALVNTIGDDGYDPKTIKATLHELEAHKAAEEAELEAFIAASYEPKWQLPTMQEVTALVGNLDHHLNEDPELGRAMLRRWLNDSQI